MRSKDVDEYIAKFEGITRERLVRLRELAHICIPAAHEKVSYGVPTICDEEGKYIVYFAGYKDFVSVYPVHLAEKVEGIEEHLSGKSTARFRHGNPLPEGLIEKLYVQLKIAHEQRSK
jgi:uncharacterized protein YdhG (YjbR/CyaY superfamily)